MLVVRASCKLFHLHPCRFSLLSLPVEVGGNVPVRLSLAVHISQYIWYWPVLPKAFAAAAPVWQLVIVAPLFAFVPQPAEPPALAVHVRPLIAARGLPLLV